MSQAEWLNRLTNLNKARDNAPHKPLLLLVFLELVETGDFVGGSLPLTPELAFRFDTYFEIVRHRRKAPPDVRMPFHHLGTQKFWFPRMANGDASKHRSTTTYVVPDPDFVSACRDAEFRRQARCILISSHFEPAEQVALYQLVGIEMPATSELPAGALAQWVQVAETVGRSARFRLDVVSAYSYTCALTGYRVTTISAGTIVDAAHIHQFANSRNDDPKNGIALCKNAHWQFDAGLWTIDDDYRVVVAVGIFSESSPNQQPLADMGGQQLLLPREQSIWPSPTHLAWHRKNVFKSCA